VTGSAIGAGADELPPPPHPTRFSIKDKKTILVVVLLSIFLNPFRYQYQW